MARLIPAIKHDTNESPIVKTSNRTKHCNRYSLASYRVKIDAAPSIGSRHVIPRDCTSSYWAGLIALHAIGLKQCFCGGACTKLVRSDPKGIEMMDLML